MKLSKKIFIVLGLVALIAGLFVPTALAAPQEKVKNTRPATVLRYKLLDDQPATLRIEGSYVCDRVTTSAEVVGKTINVYVVDVKDYHTGHGCGDKGELSFRRTLKLGNLVPGSYTVYFNPDGGGKWQKKFKFIAPLYATPTPAAPAQP